MFAESSEYVLVTGLPRSRLLPRGRRTKAKVKPLPPLLLLPTPLALRCTPPHPNLLRRGRLRVCHGFPLPTNGKPDYHRRRSWSSWPKPSLPPLRLPYNKRLPLLWAVKSPLLLMHVANARRSSPPRADDASLSLYTHPLPLLGRRTSSITRSTDVWATPSGAYALLESSPAGGQSPSARTPFQTQMTSLSSQSFSKT